MDVYCGESFFRPPGKVKSCKTSIKRVRDWETWCKTLFFFCSSWETPSLGTLTGGGGHRFPICLELEVGCVLELRSCNLKCPTGQGVLNIVLTILMALLFLGNLDLILQSWSWTPPKGGASWNTFVLPQLFRALLFILTPELEVFYVLCFCRSCWTPSWHPSSYSSPRALVAPRPSRQALATTPDSVVTRAFGLRWWQCLGLASQSERVSSILATHGNTKKYRCIATTPEICSTSWIWIASSYRNWNHFFRFGWVCVTKSVRFWQAFVAHLCTYAFLTLSNLFLVRRGSTFDAYK